MWIGGVVAVSSGCYVNGGIVVDVRECTPSNNETRKSTSQRECKAETRDAESVSAQNTEVAYDPPWYS